eukprot:TRINITY_DN3893_c0_g1_i1.p1 TRINITY_DN3893_c0_g1~~TRINITY_DN3893_c0_g1_i1.p1  ORF type:complete len:317 (+),score=72.69 TRINITY_DN3893_c0_g1_i1:38-952(+)
MKRRFVSAHHSQTLEDVSDSLSIMQFNVLADAYALDTPDINAYCDSKYLVWEYRSELIVKEIEQYGADVVCIQELDHFDDFLKPRMENLGYKGEYKKKSGDRKDGCAIFFKSSKFQLMKKLDVEIEIQLQEGSRPQSALFVHLSFTTKGETRNVIVVDTHLKANTSTQSFESTRVNQVHFLLDRLQSFLPQTSSKDILFFCGDLNTDSKSDVYRILSDVNKSSSSKIPHLSSAYANYRAEGEPEYTLWCKGFNKLLDYIFYSTDSVYPIKLLDVNVNNVFPDFIPCKDYPSDHLSLVCHFGFKE